MTAASAATMRGRSWVPVLLVAVLLTLVTAVALVWLPAPPPPLPPLPEYSGPPARFAPAIMPAQPDEPAAVVLPGDADDRAPWSHPPATDNGQSTHEAATANVRINRDRTQRLQGIQEQLRDIARSSEPDPQRLDSLLGELVEVEGSHVVGGVDMQVVRSNLQHAAEMQRLSTELETLAAAGNDPANLALMKEKVTRIQALQRQLRTDVRVAE